MAKTNLDSDLYGDIYGDEDNDFGFIEPAPEENATETPAATSAPNPESELLQPAQTSASKGEVHSLPAKPSVGSSQNGNPSLSYSAQIAQQFSAYQQTPSQERQQRQHGMTAPPKTSPIATVDSTTGDSDTVFGKKPSEMHDAGKLFIGGLNWDTTDAEGLRNYFSQFGKVDACTIMRDPSGTSRGFAFLTFEDPNAVATVTAREHFLDGKAIDPKRAIPREEHLRNTRYFVGGLAPSTTSDSMKEFFATYGKVVDATVMLDRESGRSKGFGFVTFEDANNADQLVGKNIVLDEKQIEVKMAQPRSQRDQNRNITGNTTVSLINNPINGRGESFENHMSQTNIPFIPQQQNPMSNMLFQRSVGQMPMMGSGMPMMNVNPMAMMGMNMQNFNPMANIIGAGMGTNGSTGVGSMSGMSGMNMMSGMNGIGGVGGMNAMNAMTMGNPGAMRLGMGPMGATGGMNQSAMMGSGSGMGGLGNMIPMRQGTNNLGSAMVMPFGRMAANAAGPGPMRMHSRGQHNFHPYAR
ncbi:hnRNP A1-gamma isoform [Lentinula aciculospora]|uniref:HnRNP A1-gamma isoform n=1 Tax=Lentinula aciculospora TaxID=153920 RepID=A0A9W9DQ70_9AGAR|nr:hnRNP A1-gamma isoform [Lentinula aciculospora]